MQEAKGIKTFDVSIITSSRFAFMPMTAQVLYLHLGAHSDKDGFVRNPKDICRAIGCSSKDMDLLIKSSYIDTSNVCDGIWIKGVS